MIHWSFSPAPFLTGPHGYMVFIELYDISPFYNSILNHVYRNVSFIAIWVQYHLPSVHYETNTRRKSIYLFDLQDVEESI